MRLSKSRTNKQKPDSKRKRQRKKTKPKKSKQLSTQTNHKTTGRFEKQNGWEIVHSDTTSHKQWPRDKSQQSGSSCFWRFATWLHCTQVWCPGVLHQTNEGRGHLEDTRMNSKEWTCLCFTFKKQNAFFPQTQRKAAFNLAIWKKKKKF